MDLVKKLQALVDKSSSIVFYSGAGVSAESGAPDMRADGGLYLQQLSYSPEMILSRDFYEEYPEIFFEFYRKEMLHQNVKPNRTHQKLFEMERAGKLVSIVTQNTDGLHQAAGCEKVHELYGSIYRNYCEKCGEFFNVDFMRQSDGIPLCSCGGVVRPDVVLFDEQVKPSVIRPAISDIAGADLLIVGGTTFSRYPAGGVIDYLMGGRLVLIAGEASKSDRKRADLVIEGKVSEIMDQITVSEQSF